MPPTKRTTGTAAAVTRQSKRFRPLSPATDLEEARLSALNAPPEEAGADTMRVNVQALTSTIATAVSQAVKEAAWLHSYRGVSLRKPINTIHLRGSGHIDEP